MNTAAGSEGGTRRARRQRADVGVRGEAPSIVARRLLTVLVLVSLAASVGVSGAWAQLAPLGPEYRLGGGGATIALNQTTGAILYAYADEESRGTIRALTAFNGVGLPQPRPEPLVEGSAGPPALGWSAADGGFLAAWGSTDGVLLRRLDGFGDPVAAASTLATGPVDCVGLARDLPNGNALVTWRARTGPGVEQLLAQLVNAAGEPLREPELLVSIEASTPVLSCPRSAWNPADSGYLVVWSQSSSVVTTTIGDDGALGRGRMLTAEASFYPTPSVAVAPGGSALVVWRGKVPIPGRRRTETELVAEPLDPTGTPSGEPRRLTGVDGAANGGVPWNPTVVATPSGGFLVAWDARRGPAGVGGGGIFAQETRADGRLRGRPFRISDPNRDEASPASTNPLIVLIPKRFQQPEPLYLVTWTTASVDLARPFLPEGAIRLLARRRAS